MEPIRRVKKRDPILMMLVGNKCDKVQQREVSREEGAALAQHFGCNFLETSGKTGQNVEDMFNGPCPSIEVEEKLKSWSVN